MGRPHRPNPYEGKRVRMRTGKNGMPERVPESERPWLATHVKQETRVEGKARRRAEALKRNPDHMTPVLERAQ